VVDGSSASAVHCGEATSEAPMDTQLVVSGVDKRYRDTTVLEHVDLTVRRGEVVALTGENGAGKSTLLKICAGLVSQDAGQVRLGGRLGYCPQNPGLFELLTANDHLVMFGRAAGLGRQDALARGAEILSDFGYPLGESLVTRELSGGTRQKLNLGLALLADPDLLLLDEPYQGFDHGTYVNFWDHCEAWRHQGRAVVVVTHMLAELGRVDRVVELHAHRSRAHHRSSS
jgi:ABC-type multidrug transport system ATPase subunit